MSLERRETWFWHGVRGRTPPADIDAVVAAGGGLSPARRLGIYRSAYFTRQLRVIEETFPRTRELVVEARFRELCLAYLEQYPSEAPAVERVGARFPDYLAGLAGEIRPSLAVVDLACLEWARLEALLAPDAPDAIDLNAFAAEDVGARSLVLAPSLRVVRLAQEALDLWEGASARPESRAVSVAVLRRDFAVRHDVLGEAEASALAAAGEGANLDAISACFPEPGGVERAARALAGWIQRRYVVALVSLLLTALTSGCTEAENSNFPFETGPTMKPGDDCSRCHSEGTDYPTAPVWTAAGTVFPSASSATDEGMSGVRVILSSPAGAPLEELVTNAAGNFYTARSLPEGFRVALEHDGARIEMPCPPPAGNCGACHSLPPIGQAAGRIYLPGGGTLDPRPLDCDTWTRAP